MKKIILGVLLIIGMVSAESTFKGKIILLDQNATDLVYQLPLKKYPKWVCEAELINKQKMQFVSVKAMMQVYQHQEYFLKRNLIPAKIKTLYVQDYLNGERVEASKAVYLFGSKVVGPHGDDLIPFISPQNAEPFKLKHGGTKILPFERLTKGLIRYLDM
jgi:nitrous oxide reductase accessory protein NosL